MRARLGGRQRGARREEAGETELVGRCRHDQPLEFAAAAAAAAADGAAHRAAPRDPGTPRATTAPTGTTPAPPTPEPARPPKAGAARSAESSALTMDSSPSLTSSSRPRGPASAPTTPPTASSSRSAACCSLTPIAVSGVSPTTDARSRRRKRLRNSHACDTACTLLRDGLGAPLLPPAVSSAAATPSACALRSTTAAMARPVTYAECAGSGVPLGPYLPPPRACGCSASSGRPPIAAPSRGSMPPSRSSRARAEEDVTTWSSAGSAAPWRWSGMVRPSARAVSIESAADRLGDAALIRGRSRERQWS